MTQPPFDVILADPPWEFKTRSDKGKGRSPEQHYPCMTLDDLCALPVADLASPNAVLFLWVTWPTLYAYPPRLLEAWGFEYRALAWVWVKTNKHSVLNMLKDLDKTIGSRQITLAEWLVGRLWFMGTGYYTRANSEPCLIAVRKDGQAPVADKGVKSVLCAPVAAHSAKPLEQYRRIERLYPQGSRLELFARQQQPGWVSLGNEIQTGQDIKKSMLEIMAGSL